MKVRAILKKVSHTFIAMALIITACLTMSMPVSAAGSNVSEKGINYREYVSFVIDGTVYPMTDLTGTGADLSGVDPSAVVYAKIDVAGLNTAMNNAGISGEKILMSRSYMSRYVTDTDPIVYHFSLNQDGNYSIICEDDGSEMTLENLAYVQTVGVYMGNTDTSNNYWYGMDALQVNLFKLNILGTFPAKAAVTYVDTNGNELYKFDYVSEEQGYWGASMSVEYSTFPEIGNSFELAGYPSDSTSAGLIFGYEGRELEVTVNKLDPDFTELLSVLEEVENLEEKNYTEESMQALLDAVEQAQDVADKGNAAYQYEVDAAQAAVRTAIDNLTEEAVTVVKTDLKAALDKYAEYDSKDYTEASWTAYQEAYNAALKVYNDENATQEQVNNALTALNNAEKGLTKAGTTDKTSETTAQTPGTGSATGAPVTGDNSYVQVYAIMAVMALAAAAAVLAKKRKFNE